MKIAQATKEEKAWALAALDGWAYGYFDGDHNRANKNICGIGWIERDGKHRDTRPGDYLTSYDAIIPLIQKQTDEIMASIYNKVTEARDVGWTAGFIALMRMTPEQLADALLVAVGKFEA